MARREPIGSHGFEREGEAQARYEQAIALCTDAILRMHFGERLINKIFGRAMQSHAAGLVLVMHCEAEAGLGPRPTLALIQREMGAGRTLAGFFALLRLAGYLEQVPDAADARQRHLQPTAPFFAGLRQWLAQHLRCAEIVGRLPEGIAARFETDEAFCRAYVARSRALLARTRATAAGSGAWPWLDRFDCGDRIGLMLLHAHYQADPASASRSFGFASREVAERLGISRSHVRNVLNRAEAAGLLVQERRSGTVALAPRFLSEARDWFLTFWGWAAEVAETMERDGAVPAPEGGRKRIDG